MRARIWQQLGMDSWSLSTATHGRTRCWTGGKLHLKQPPQPYATEKCSFNRYQYRSLCNLGIILWNTIKDKKQLTQATGYPYSFIGFLYQDIWCYVTSVNREYTHLLLVELGDTILFQLIPVSITGVSFVQGVKRTQFF